jgi:hypothetical protein
MADAKGKAIVAFGLITVGFWLSCAVFPELIPPLAHTPGPDLKGLLALIPAWIREQDPSMSRPDAEIIAALRREGFVIIARKWIEIAFGVTSGVLIARRHQTGRRLAITLCAVLLGWFALVQARSIWWNVDVIALWATMARRLPRHFARTVVNLLFYAVTITYLTRSPVVAWFRRGQDPSGAPKPSR